MKGYLSGRIYYAKRVGLRWGVYCSYQDESFDPAVGGNEWPATITRFWTERAAMQMALDMWSAFNSGVWCESGRYAALNGGRSDG